MTNALSSFYKFGVDDAGILGQGCFCKEKLEEGEIICKFTGPKMNFKDFSEKYDFNNGNPLQIDKDVFLDLVYPYVFFNHSCEPNAGLRNNGILFALRPIQPGEEITYDYSTTIDDVTWSMECFCGKEKCRKVIGDFLSVPHEVKGFYLGKNAILSYLKELYY